MAGTAIDEKTLLLAELCCRERDLRVIFLYLPIRRFRFEQIFHDDSQMFHFIRVVQWRADEILRWRSSYQVIRGFILNCRVNSVDEKTVPSGN